MACWSSENATRAYLRTLKMGKRGKEPDVSEFIAALAAGNNAQFMAMACDGPAGSSILLALVAAANQTGGRVVCILRGYKEYLHASQKALGQYADCVEFVIGGDHARPSLLNDYKGADFVLVDCKTEDHKAMLVAARKSANQNGAIVVGYNAIRCGRPWFDGMKPHFLPIGEGLMVIRISPSKVFGTTAKKSHWVVEVDKCTGEEHVYKITSPHNKEIEA